VGWRRVFSSVGVVRTYRRGLLPISSAWYQRTRLHGVISRKAVGVLTLAATETPVSHLIKLPCAKQFTANLIKFFRLLCVLKMEAPTPFEIYQTTRRYFIFIHLDSFDRCAEALELSSQV